MKKTLTLFLLAIIFAIPTLADEPDISIQADLDMYLGYKMGIRYEVNYKLDLVTGFGVNVIAPSSQFCYSAYASYQTMEIYDKWDIGLNFGILQGIFDNTSDLEDQYFYINPGLSMYVSYPITDNIRLGAQGGMVMMIGYDMSTWGGSLEPFMGVSLIYSK